jgi:membrane protease YdiL (CAAX protease family)
MKTEHRRLLLALAVYAGFTLLFLAANVINYIGEKDGTLEVMEPIAGMILGFLVFPVFCIGLPLWLARRWGLEYSFWPRGKNWLAGVALAALYVILMQYQSIANVLAMGIPAADFLIHFTSSALFHASYYALFAVLLLPVLRRVFGVGGGLTAVAVLFAVYHLAGFYYFPAGVTLELQVLLFCSFFAAMLLYLWTENLILVALVHTIGGSLGLAVNGTVFNRPDEMLAVSAVILTGFFVYMIVFHLRHRDRPYRAGWWLQAELANGENAE